MKNARKRSLWKGCLVPFFQVNRSSFPTIGGFRILVGVFYDDVSSLENPFQHGNF